MLIMRDQSSDPSDDGNLPNFAKIAPERLAGFGSELDEDAASVVRISATNEKSFADHRLEPTERGRRRYGGGNTEARYGNPDWAISA